MKKIIALLLSVVLTVSICTFTVAAEEEISIVVNGEKLVTDVPPAKYPVYSENGYYVGDRVMVVKKQGGSRYSIIDRLGAK